MPRNAEERSHHSNIISFQHTLQEGAVFQKCLKFFDLTGKITPITATMKLDLHTLVKRSFDWDDVLPDKLRPIWVFHFEMMREIGKIKFQEQWFQKMQSI